MFKRKIIIDAFTKCEPIAKLSPIKKAGTPNWLKDLASTVGVNKNSGIVVEAPTIKRCDGISDLFKNSFVLPLWSDLIIKTYESGAWAWECSADVGVGIESNQIQLAGALSDFIHLKIRSPWLLKEKTGVNFLFHQPFWHQLSHIQDIHTPPAIVNYLHQHGTHINTFLPKKDNTLHISADTPMCYITPMTDKEVVIKCHAVDEAEFKKIEARSSFRSTFLNSYKNKVKKCPFGFDRI